MKREYYPEVTQLVKAVNNLINSNGLGRNIGNQTEWIVNADRMKELIKIVTLF